MRERVLTDEEKRFAERNIQILSKYKNSEYSGTAAIAYLSAVQTWFSKPELQKKYAFPAIAITQIKKEISKEQRRERDSIKAVVNLNTTIGEDSDITYLDCVTNHNMQFTPYVSAKDDMEKIACPQIMKKAGKSICEENLLVSDFLHRSDKNMLLKYATKEEAKKKGHTIRLFIRRNHLTSIYSMVRDNCIYVIRHTGGYPDGSFI